MVKGEGRSVIGKDAAEFEEGDAICIPAGEFHNVINTNDKPMKLFTIYSPPSTLRIWFRNQSRRKYRPSCSP